MGAWVGRSGDPKAAPAEHEKWDGQEEEPLWQTEGGPEHCPGENLSQAVQAEAQPVRSPCYERGRKMSHRGGGGGDGDAPSSSSAAAQRVLRLLVACPSSSGLRQIHAQVLLHGLCRNTWVASSFIGACNSARLLPYALLFFAHLRGKLHVFVCNSLLRALAHSLSPESSSRCLPVYTHLLRASVRPNNYTFPLVLKSLADLRLLPQGRSVHAHVARAGHGGDIYVQNSLLNLYSSCGEMAACEQLFDEMRVRDAVSWTTMIEGYRNAAQLDEALVAFERMQFAGAAPNRVTVVNAAAACAARGALEMGVWIHSYVRRRGWELDVVMGTSLVDMYGKCGRAEDSVAVFSAMSERNVYTWNSLIRGLAMAKGGEEALRWFSRMEEGIQTDAVIGSATVTTAIVERLRLEQEVLLEFKQGW